MSLTRQEEDGCAIVKIEGAMSVAEAGSIRDELIECLDKYESLTLDLEEVSGIDTAGIQLLHSARISAQNVGKSFAVTNPSSAAEEAVIRVGMKPEEVLF